MGHPLGAAGVVPSIDFAGLARLFVTPVLYGEFAPSSFWRGVDLLWQPPEPVEGGDFAEGFARAVAACVGDADVVAVALSGGIDSLAVLWHTAALGRRVLAFTADLLDDTGTSAGSVVAEQLDALGLSGRVQLSVIPPDFCDRAPKWSPFGPRMDALPRVNATIAELAADASAGVLLSGNGADELLSVPRYAAVEVMGVHGVGGAGQYVRDMATAGHGRTGEYAGVIARWLPRSARARAYAAVTWPQWCAPQVSAVLAGRWREPTLAWARSWVRDVLNDHAGRWRTWAAADAWDSWWPRAYLPAAGPVAEASPFTDGRLAAAVWAKPLGWRYDPAGRSPYLRVKGAVAALFPPAVRAMLPVRKRYYATALAAAYAAPIAIPTAASVSLLDQAALDTTTDTATRMMTAAVEAWLAGAVDAGAVNAHLWDLGTSVAATPRLPV